MKQLLLVAFTIALISLSSACGPQAPPDTRAADEQAIREMEAEWSKSAATKDVDSFMAFYADDAAAFPPNAPIATGRDAIRSAMAGMFSAPGFSLGFKSTKVEVARSGDLAYSYGAYTMTMNDPKGNPMTDKGKFVTVYRKQPDGKWKTVADMYSSDLPPAPPAEPARKK